MKKSEITVTIDCGGYMEGSIHDAIENKLVASLEEHISEKINKAVERRILELANAEFNKLAKGELEKFFSKTFSKTNTYGEATGQTTTLREMLLKQFHEYLEESVNDKGERENYNRGLKRAQWMLNKLAHEPLQAAVEETVKKIADEAKKQVQASVARYIADQLTPAVNVPRLKG